MLRLTGHDTVSGIRWGPRGLPGEKAGGSADAVRADQDVNERRHGEKLPLLFSLGRIHYARYMVVRQTKTRPSRTNLRFQKGIDIPRPDFT